MWYSLTGEVVPIGNLYTGDCAVGDRAATDAEITAWNAAIQSAANSNSSANSSANSVPVKITPRQFYQQLAVQNVISQSEALAFVQTGTIPSEMANIVSTLPANNQFAANMKIIGGSQYLLSDPLTIEIATAFGWSNTQLNTFWVAASEL